MEILKEVIMEKLFITYEEALERSNNNPSIEERYKFGKLLADKELVNDLNGYYLKNKEKAKEIIIKLFGSFPKKPTTILKQDAIALLGSFLNEFEKGSKIKLKDSSYGKNLLYLEKIINEDIQLFGENQKAIIIFKNNKIIDYELYNLNLQKFEDEDYYKSTLKQILYVIFYELYPNFNHEQIVLIINRRIKLMTLRDLEKITGLSRSLLNRYENGTINITNDSQKKLAKALSFNIEEFSKDFWILKNKNSLS